MDDPYFPPGMPVPTTTPQQDRTYITLHIARKVAQTCGLAIPPIAALLLALRGRFSMPRLLRTTAKGTFKWALPPTAYLGYGHLYNADDISVQVTAWRIRENKSQVRTDQFAEIGAAACAATLAVIPSAGPFLTRVAGGAVLGMGYGILAHVASRPPDLQGKPFNEARPNPHTAVIEQYTKPSSE